MGAVEASLVSSVQVPCSRLGQKPADVPKPNDPRVTRYSESYDATSRRKTHHSGHVVMPLQTLRRNCRPGLRQCHKYGSSLTRSPSNRSLSPNSNGWSPKLPSHKSKRQKLVKLGRFRDSSPILHTPHFSRACSGLQAIPGGFGEIVRFAALPAGLPALCQEGVQKSTCGYQRRHGPPLSHLKSRGSRGFSGTLGGYGWARQLAA